MSYSDKRRKLFSLEEAACGGVIEGRKLSSEVQEDIECPVVM